MKLKITIELLPESNDEKEHFANSSGDKVFRTLIGIPAGKGFGYFERIVSIITNCLELADRP